MVKVIQIAGLLVSCLLLFSVDWKSSWLEIPIRRKMSILALNIFAVGFLSVLFVRIIEQPREWDFLSYYLWSRVVGSGLPVYEPSSSRDVLGNIQIPIVPTQEFVREVVVPGPNNPPTALLWARFWIGDRPFATAHLIWMILTVVSLGLACYLLARAQQSLWPTVVILLFPVLAFAPVTRSTINYGQTTFLILSLIVLAWRCCQKPRVGAWLALGSLLKPYMAMLGLYLVVRKRWAAILAALAVGLGGLGISGFVVGFDQVFAFFRGDFAANAPNWLYTESVNQSLLATILRILDPEISGGKTLTHPVFLAITAVLSGVTVYLGFRAGKEQDHLVFLLVLSLALLIYPGTLFHYSLFLLLPWLFLARSAWDKGLPPALLAIVFWGGLISFSIAAFVANLATWLVFAVWLFKIDSTPTEPTILLRDVQ